MYYLDPNNDIILTTGSELSRRRICDDMSSIIGGFLFYIRIETLCEAVLQNIPYETFYGHKHKGKMTKYELD